MNNTTDVAGTDTDLERELEMKTRSEYIDSVRKLIWHTVPPFHLVFGTLGNIMVLVLLCRPSLRRSAFNVYFAALAAFALGFLYTQALPDWIQFTFDFNFYGMANALCRFRNWLQLIFISISSWLMAAMTVHRAASVVWPHYIHELCSRRRAYMVIAALTAACMLMYLYSFVASGAIDGTGQCTFSATQLGTFARYYMTWFELIVGFGIPFIIIICSNIRLVAAMYAISPDEKVTGRKSLPPTLALNNKRLNQSRKKSKMMTASLTKTLVVTSCVFVALLLPTFVMEIFFPRYENYISTLKISETEKQFKYRNLRLAHAIIQQLEYCNASVNFYLYILTGSQFRNEFLKFIIIRKNRMTRMFSSIRYRFRNVKANVVIPGIKLEETESLSQIGEAPSCKTVW